MPAVTYEAKWSGTIPDDAHVYISSRETTSSEHGRGTEQQDGVSSQLHTRLKHRVRREAEEVEVEEGVSLSEN